MNAMLHRLAALLACAALAGAAHAQSGIKPKPGGQGLRAKPAAETPAPAAAPAEGKPAEVDPKRIEAIFTCLSAGLPQDWKRAWVRVEETRNDRGEREFEAQFFYSRGSATAAGEPLKTCDARQVAAGVYELNEYLPNYDQRQWKSATLEFTSEGAYSLKYDYGK